MNMSEHEHKNGHEGQIEYFSSHLRDQIILRMLKNSKETFGLERE